MKKSSLKEAIVAVTYRCNSRCKMCGIWKKEKPEELDIELIKNIPGNLTDINITGGEPFLYGGLIEVIEILSRKSPKASIIISSNGFLTKKIIDSVKQILLIKPDLGIAISLDGIGELHDQIRGIEGAYSKVIATISELKKLGVKKLRLSFTLSDFNADELKKIYELSASMGIELSLTLVHSSEQYFNTKNTLDRKNEMVESIDWLIQKELSGFNLKHWARAYYAYGMKQFISTGKRILPDYSGKLGIFIDPNGNIFPSDVSNYKMGNLTDISDVKFRIYDSAPNWMICTARQAIKKHWFRTIMWIIRNKAFSYASTSDK